MESYEHIKIAMFDTKPYDKEVFDKINQSYKYKIKYFETKLNIDSVSLAKGYDVVCVFVNDIIDKEVIGELEKIGVKLIALRCAGYNNVDINCIDKNMTVVRVPEYSPYAVAEHAVGLILDLNRKIHKAYNRTRDHNFSLNGLLGFDIHEKTVGVIGTGRIGKVFAKIMNGFGAKVIAYDIFQDEQFAKENNVQYVELDQLYATSDIISLHCPLNSDSDEMINIESIKKMKDKVMLINTGRGRLINTRDLLEGIKIGKIGTVGLDVYEEESDIFFKDLSNEILEDEVLVFLLTLPNVIMTSHQAYFTTEALDNIATTTLENICDFFHNGKCVNSVK
jgi:D-lactate dehydrogenase